MSIEEIKNAIAEILRNPSAAQIYFVLRHENVFIVKLADIENEKTAPEIKKMFHDSLKEQIVSNEDICLRNLSSADETVNSIYKYDYDEYPEELGVFKDFNITDSVNYNKFNFEQDDLSKLYGYIIYLGSMEKGVTLFKKHYPISLIKRDAFLLGCVKSKERFERVDGNDIIRLNGIVQLIRIETTIYITDLKVLEKNFGFDKLIHKAADEAINQVQDIELLEDIEVLKDAAEDIGFARKLSKVKNSSPILNLNIPVEEVVAFTKKTPVLADKFKYSTDGSKIRLDTKKSKEAFVKLLNDAFLHSELTKLYYDARAKDKLSQN